MEINPATTAANTAQSAARSGGTESGGTESGGALAADFQTFLTLLTTQMRNQDPLKPMESTEFVAQLASFSSVEQQIRTNDRLDSIYTALSGGTADGLAAWIGREVRAPGKADFAGQPIEIGMKPLEGADRAILVVRNDFGQEVARRTIDPQAEVASWDGTDSLGNAAAHGRYGFTIESFTGDVLRDTQDGQIFSKVSEVRIEDGTPILLTEGGGRVAMDEISAVR
jgi:flagellar basal-body rod modification protein FlgD